MVGSWVRRGSPVRGPPRKSVRREAVPSRAKRRRLNSRPPPRPLSSISRSTSVSAECTPCLSLATSSSTSTSSLSTPPPPSSRSQSAFSVVVPGYTRSEDDYGSREIRSVRATRSTAKLSSSETLHSCSGWFEQEDDVRDEELQAATLPSEGDVLDMFAYDDDDPL